MKLNVTLMVIIALATSLFRGVAAVEPANAPVVAELTIQTEGNLARISVYLINKSNAPCTLFTGRVGSSSMGKFDPVDLDDVAKGSRPYGNGELVVPELTFGSIQFSAPTTVHWGATFRNMRPTLLELAEGERALYCAFSVPSLYVKGDFISGRLQFPELIQEKAKAPSLEVPVTKCTRK